MAKPTDHNNNYQEVKRIADSHMNIDQREL